MAEREQVKATPETFVTADDLANHLKITRRQVLEITRRGLIPAYPLGIGKTRRVWRYKISEVEAGIASGVRKPVATQKDAAPEEETSKMPSGVSRSRRRKL